MKLEDNKIEIKEQPKVLRGKKKEKQIIDIPDTMETDKEDNAIKKVREDNKNPEEEKEKEDIKRGKCGCLIY